MLNRLKHWIATRTRNWYMDQSTGQVQLVNGTRADTAAQNLSAVHCAVSVIAGAAATMPIHVYVRQEKEARERALGHEVYAILHDRPNDYQTPAVFKRYLFRQLLLRGNAYALIGRSNGGKLKALIPLHPDNVEPKIREDGSLVYLVRMRKAERVPIEPWEMFHVKGDSEDGIVGLSVLEIAARSFALANITEEFSKKYFDQGTTVAGKLTIPEKFNDERMKKVRDSINKLYSGVDNSHGIFVAQYGVDFEPFPVSGKDAMFLESRQFSIEDIARWFNLQPHKLKHWAQSQTYGNLESENVSFIQDTMLPWLTAFEQEAGAKLLADESDHYAEFSTAALMRGDTTTRANYYGQMSDRGIMSINEIRRLENLPPVEGGDEHNKPLNMGTLGEPDPKPNNQDKKVRNAFRPLIRQALEYLAAVEADRIERMAGRPRDQVTTWAKRFFAEEHRNRCEQILEPVLMAYGTTLGEQINTAEIVRNYQSAQLRRIEDAANLKDLATEIRSEIREDVLS